MSDFIELPANKLSISMRKLVFGVGVNDASYITNPRINGKQAICPFYKIWKTMLQRCYSISHQKTHPTYKGCTVHKDWLIFSKFKSWMAKQNWKGRQLDKDIIKPGNKIYSQETCVFVDNHVNSLLTNNGASRGLWPQGVTWHKGSKAFRALCCVDGKARHLGSFATSIEAEHTYKQFKAKEIRRVAELQFDLRVKKGLLKHAEILSKA